MIPLSTLRYNKDITKATLVRKKEKYNYKMVTLIAFTLDCCVFSFRSVVQKFL